MEHQTEVQEKKTKKVFASLAAVSMVGVAGVAGTMAALTDTTDNTPNYFNAAWIELSDNDGDTPTASYMYQVDNVEPAQYVERCITVSYAGSLPSTVALTLDPALPVNATAAAEMNLTIDAGTQTTPVFDSATSVEGEPNPLDPADADDSNCGDFAAGTGGTALVSQTLADFAADANGVTYGPAAGGTFEPGDEVTYRVRLELDAAADLGFGTNESGNHRFVWTAVTA